MTAPFFGAPSAADDPDEYLPDEDAHLATLWASAQEALNPDRVTAITTDYAGGLRAWDYGAVVHEAWPCSDTLHVQQDGRRKADAALDRAETVPEARALIVEGAQMAADKARRAEMTRRYAAQAARSHAAYVGRLPVPPR